MSSVRFICGTQDIHKELESQIAKFHKMEDCILYPSGFDSNAGFFEAIALPVATSIAKKPTLAFAKTASPANKSRAVCTEFFCKSTGGNYFVFHVLPSVTHCQIEVKSLI